jgi:hypothetical protein
MDEIVELLRIDRRQARRRRALVGALLAALAATSSVSVVGLGSLRHRRCAGAEPHLAGLWDGRQPEAVRAAFTATGAPFAAEAYRAVAAAFAGYRVAWQTQYREACEATQVRGEQSPELMDLRMRCLERRRGEAKALADVLASADLEVVTRAKRSVDAISDLARCADAGLLTAKVALPSVSSQK